MDEATSSVTQSHTGREGEVETGDCVSVGEESYVRQTGLLPYPAPHSLVGKKGPDLYPGLEPTPLSPAPSPHRVQPASFRVGSRGCGVQAAVDPAGCEVAMWTWQVCLSRLPAGAALLASGAGLEKADAEGLQLPIWASAWELVWAPWGSLGECPCVHLLISWPSWIGSPGVGELNTLPVTCGSKIKS